jgi:hypothetical protein
MRGSTARCASSHTGKATFLRPKARIAAAVLLFLAGCAAPPPRPEQAKVDPTKEAGYADAVEQLAAVNREAEGLLKGGRSPDAAAAITKGLPLQTRLLAAPQPTLGAMEAVSDLDDLYARMLLSKHENTWARMLFQKNLARWKNWKPQADDTMRRLRRAEAGIAECDRRLK